MKGNTKGCRWNPPVFLEAHNAVKPQLSKPVFLKTFLNTSSFWRLIRKYSGLVCSTYICILIQACLVRIMNPTTFLLKICQDEKSGLLKLYTHSKIHLDLIFLDTFKFLGQKCNFCLFTQVKLSTFTGNNFVCGPWLIKWCTIRNIPLV